MVRLLKLPLPPHSILFAIFALALLFSFYPAGADQAILHANTTLVNTTNGSATRSSWTAADWLGEIGFELMPSQYLAAGRMDDLRVYQGGNPTNDAFIRANWTRAMPSDILSLNWIYACTAFNKTGTKDLKKFGIWNYTGSKWIEVADGGTSVAEWGFCFNVTGENVTHFVGSGNSFVTVSRTYGTNAEGMNMNTMNITLDYVPIDTTPPAVSLSSPADNSWNNSRTIYFGFTATDASAIKNCSLRTNESGWTIDWNVSEVSSGVPSSIQRTFASDGTFNWTVECYDASANNNLGIAAPNWSVHIDTVLPTIYVDSPGNTTYYQKTVDLKVNANEPINTWMYSINNTQNISFSPNTTISVSSGVNNITVWANDSAGNMNYSRIFFTFLSTLQVNMSEPDYSIVTNIPQNATFLVNATVVCRQGSCGDVSGTIRYNGTSSVPDTEISTVPAQPLYINETPAAATKACPGNPLSEGDFCNLTWVLNATDINMGAWKIGVNFSSGSGSDMALASANQTENATVAITSCISDVTVNWDTITFGEPTIPSSIPYDAVGNAGYLYNITVNPGSCNTDIYIKGSDFENQTFGYKIGAGNLTWSNTSNSYDSSYNMTYEYAPLKLNVPRDTNVTTWYWMNVPPVFAAKYNSTVYIGWVENGKPAP